MGQERFAGPIKTVVEEQAAFGQLAPGSALAYDAAHLAAQGWQVKRRLAAVTNDQLHGAKGPVMMVHLLIAAAHLAGLLPTAINRRLLAG